MPSTRELDEQIASLEEEHRIVRRIRELKEQKVAASPGELPVGPATKENPLDLTFDPNSSIEEDVKDVGLGKRKWEESTGPDVDHAGGILETAVLYYDQGGAGLAKRPKFEGVQKRDRKRNHLSSVNDDPAYASIVMRADGKYVELHCCFCKGNAKAKSRKVSINLFTGGLGLRANICFAHRDRFDGIFTHEMVMELCVKRKLTKKEMKSVDEGDHVAYKVTPHPVLRMDARPLIGSVPKQDI